MVATNKQKVKLNSQYKMILNSFDPDLNGSNFYFRGSGTKEINDQFEATLIHIELSIWHLTEVRGADTFLLN